MVLRPCAHVHHRSKRHLEHVAILRQVLEEEEAALGGQGAQAAEHSEESDMEDSETGSAEDADGARPTRTVSNAAKKRQRRQQQRMQVPTDDDKDFDGAGVRFLKF